MKRHAKLVAVAELDLFNAPNITILVEPLDTVNSKPVFPGGPRAYLPDLFLDRSPKESYQVLISRGGGVPHSALMPKAR